MFPATHKSGHRHGMAEFTTSLKSTPSTRAALEGACEREHVGQHVDSDAGKRLMECHDDRKRAAQALDQPRHHTAKDGVYGARGARLTHSQNSDAGERTQLKVKSET